MILFKRLLEICRDYSKMVILLPTIFFSLTFVLLQREGTKTETRVTLELDQSFGDLNYRLLVAAPQVETYLKNHHRVKDVLDKWPFLELSKKNRELIEKSYRASKVSDSGIFTITVQTYSSLVARRFLDYVVRVIDSNQNEGVCEPCHVKPQRSQTTLLLKRTSVHKKLDELFVKSQSGLAPDEDVEACLESHFAVPIRVIEQIELSSTPVFRKRAKLYIFSLFWGFIWALSIAVYKHSLDEK